MAIVDRFVLRERIGGGTAADVHRAFDQKLNRDVVVRILRADVAADDEYVERFLREAEAATGIRHPNVVEVLDHGVIDGQPFLVRELVEGSTLNDLLERDGPLPEEDARALAEQIARGVEAAHARGVLHRDLNAGNVFVTGDGTAKVVDFGMPTVPTHPAPEQVSRDQIDERTDVYGLGAVLYQMLTGHTPRGRPVPPRQLAAHVSHRIDAIALRALESDPARRYATAAAMADALAPAPVVVPMAAPVARPTLVSPAAPTERLARPASTMSSRRRPSALPHILLAIPLLLALLVAAFALPRPSPTNTAVLSATTTPQATTAPSAFPAPTSLPPVETTPEPTTPPFPPPTAEPPPPMPAPTLAPAPPPAAVAPAPAPSPVAPIPPSPAASVVRSFYDLINQERFDEAALLWSPRMQANYPPSTNIYGRFDRTREIVIGDIAPVPQNTGGATVAIDILEVLDSGVTRRWVGQWYLVWDGSRWLMDLPSLRAG
jgi:serine/threonine-protein kinase